MGRLRKAKIDLIIKLRNDGYTQAETAEKAGVHLKTVQRYDPLKKSGKTATVKEGISLSKDDLESRLRNLGDWINAIQLALMNKNITAVCPNCTDSLLFLDEYDDNLYVCKKCHYKMPFPIHGLGK